MTRAVALLARVNEIDLVVDATKARLHEIAEALREPAALVATRQAVAAGEQELADCQAVQQQGEKDQADAAAKMKRAEEKLYSGSVKNPRELEDAQRDVAQLSHQRQAVEDRLLEALVCTENATKTLSAARAELTRLSTEWASKQGTLRAEYTSLKARLAAELARQAATRRGVPEKMLATYDLLRSRKGGRAVAILEGDSCSACRVAVPPSKLAEVFDSEQLVYCGNCGRLLWCE